MKTFLATAFLLFSMLVNASEFAVKDPVRVATTANLTHSGEQTIDGVAIKDGDRVLDKNATSAELRGVWVAHYGAWARAEDSDEFGELLPGALVFVSEGTANGNKFFALTTNAPIILGYTAMTWADVTGTGASASFATVTAGTNAAALVIGTGGSLATSGTGTIDPTMSATFPLTWTGRGILSSSAAGKLHMANSGTTSSFCFGGQGATDPCLWRYSAGQLQAVTGDGSGYVDLVTGSISAHGALTVTTGQLLGDANRFFFQGTANGEVGFFDNSGVSPANLNFGTGVQINGKTAKGLELAETWNVSWNAENAAPGTGDLFLNRRKLPGVLRASTALNSGSYAEIDAGRLVLAGDNGEAWIKGQTSEAITLSTGGVTTDSSADLLPANGIIEAVTCRVTTTITTATDWAVGDGADADRFTTANATLTAGTSSVGLNHVGTTAEKQTAGAKLRITTTGTPGAGAVLCTSFWRQFAPPAADLITLGDSKTFRSGWQNRLATELRAAGALVSIPYNGGIGGITVTGTEAAIATILSTTPSHEVYRVLINLGVNDCAAMPSAAAWVASYDAVLDSISARWPLAAIWIMRPWMAGSDACAATQNGYITSIIALDAGRRNAGPDEAVWLKAGDNGAANTTDGVHYSAAGNIAAVAAWKAALGY